MPIRSKPGEISVSLEALQTLLNNFDTELQGDDLRGKVLALIPVFRQLRDIGSSLVPAELSHAAIERILYYFRKYPQTVIAGEEINVVAGINDWPRRVRQLRIEQGWSIISGITAKAMISEGDLPRSLNGQDLSLMRTDDYLLLEVEQDREAAHRWHSINAIRRERISVKEKILKYLRLNVGSPITGEELRYLAKNRQDWPRRTRELRTEDGWPVVTRQTGRPDLPIGVYILEADRQTPPNDRRITDNTRLAVLERDHYTCTSCGWDRSRWSREVPRILELHHIQHHADRGENNETNLTTLCNVCHDAIHRS